MPTKPHSRLMQTGDEVAVSRGLVSLLAAEGDNPAAGKGPSKFSMVLYTGETMTRWGWNGQQEAIVLDVAGFKPKRDGGWPAMVDHWQRAGTIDKAAADVAAATITGTGRFLSSDADLFPAAARAEAILAQGHALQCSGYWVPAKIEKVEAGAKSSVNGKTVTGPIQIWREFSMREGSFTDLGRDEMTHAELAASLAGRRPMSEAPTQESPTMPNFALIASLKTFVGADRAIELAAAQPDDADLAAFLPQIEAAFTDLRAKLDKSTTDLAASVAKVTQIEADLAAAKAAPVVKLPGGGDGSTPAPRTGGAKTDDELTAAFKASKELQETYGDEKVYLSAMRRQQDAAAK